MRHISLYVVAVILLLGACRQDVVFEQKNAVPQQLWQYNQPIQFSFDISDTTILYNILLDIHHNMNYPYQNIYTIITTTYPNNTQQREQLSLELSEKKDVWSSDCSDTDCYLTIGLQQNAYFNQLGKHTITLEQYTRQDSLPGIVDLTLRIEKSEKKKAIK
ncbi:MAG: gliding motility lipoprotein GldH [Saprospiraceae bacterium]|nr:gliding motility lipoprotein GldH [Saprospiraceae bacterium]MBP7680209.1 gliding motility lipoprotein GldH [Saprospiraceae bacterium]